MNTTRLLYFLILYVSFFSAIYSGARVLYVLFFMLVLLLLAALIMNVWSAFTFAYIQNISATSTVRDGKLMVHLEIHNERPIPYPLMKIRIRTPKPGRYLERTFNLPARSHVAFDIPITFPYRGEFLVGLSVVDIRDIFGLLSIPFHMNRLPYYREKKILVYPRVFQLPERSIRPLDAKTYTRYSLSSADSKESFSHTRVYQPGDKARQIHWKLSARMGELYSRQYDVAIEPSMLILMDTVSGPYGDIGTLEWQDTACSSAATLISYVLQHRYRTTLVTQEDESIHLRGDTMADFHLFVDALARLPFTSRLSTPDLIRHHAGNIREHGSIVLITAAEPDDAMLSAFRPLQRTDADFSIIVARPSVSLHPAEKARHVIPVTADQGDESITEAIDEKIGIDAAHAKGPRVVHVTYGEDLSIVLGDFV